MGPPPRKPKMAIEVFLSRWGNVDPLLFDVRPTDSNGVPVATGGVESC
jgi:hypothetical protein